MKVKKSSIIHYLMLFLLLHFHSSVLQKYYEDVLLVIAFVFSILCICTNRNCKINRNDNIKKYYLYFTIIIGFLLISALLNNFSLSVLSIGNIVARLLITSTAILYNREKVVDRFVKIVVFFATVSLIMYSIQIISLSIVNRITVEIDNQYYYNFFFSCAYRIHPFRNTGIFIEPGAYVVVLLPVLYFLLMHPELCYATQRRKRESSIIIIATIITAQSTTGYIGLIVVLFSWFFKKNYGKARWSRLLVVGIIAIVVTWDLSRDNGLINQVIFSKILSNSGQINLLQSTGRSRIVSMYTDFSVISQYPFGAGFTIYNSIWRSLLTQYIPDSSSCMGITKALAAYGIPAVLTFFVFILRSLFKNEKSNIERIACILIFLILTMSQPQVFYPVVILLFCVRRLEDDKNQKIKS